METVRKLFPGIAVGFALGILNGINCNKNGFYMSLLLFVLAGTLYAYISYFINELTENMDAQMKIFIKPIVKAFIVFISVFGFASGHGNRLYSIFHYREKDPIGPGFFWMALLFLFPICVYLVNLFHEVIHNNE